MKEEQYRRAQEQERFRFLHPTVQQDEHEQDEEKSNDDDDLLFHYNAHHNDPSGGLSAGANRTNTMPPVSPIGDGPSSDHHAQYVSELAEKRKLLKKLQKNFVARSASQRGPAERTQELLRSMPSINRASSDPQGAAAQRPAPIRKNQSFHFEGEDVLNRTPPVSPIGNAPNHERFVSFLNQRPANFGSIEDLPPSPILTASRSHDSAQRQQPRGPASIRKAQSQSDLARSQSDLTSKGANLLKFL